MCIEACNHKQVYLFWYTENVKIISHEYMCRMVPFHTNKTGKTLGAIFHRQSLSLCENTIVKTVFQTLQYTMCRVSNIIRS